MEGKKGVSQFLAASLLIVVGIVAATLVSGWVVQVSTKQSATVVNRTQSQLSCQYASMYTSNITWDCNASCFTGVPYKINATIENIGSTKLDVYNLFVSLTDGTSYRIDSNRTSISTGSVQTKNFNNMLVRSLQKMPSETMDYRRAYGNDSNTVGLWHFDESSGTNAKDSALNNTGTLYNGTTACTGLGTCPLWNGSGRLSNSLTLDGLNDFVNLSNSSLFNINSNKLTLEFWMNIKDVTKTNQKILAKGNGGNDTIWGLGFNGTTGILIFNLTTSSTTTLNSSIALSNNVWYHIASTYDGAFMKLYINGQLDTQTAKTGNIASSALPVLVGAHSGSSPEYLNGTIDELRISNISRVFNTTLTYDIVHPSISSVKVYNETGVQIDSQTGLSGNTYSRNITNVTTATDYRVVVQDANGATLEKWYPSKNSGCRSRSDLDKITISTANCPELTDTYYGGDMFFVNCVP